MRAPPPVCSASENFSFLTIRPNSWAPTAPIQGFQAPEPHLRVLPAQTFLPTPNILAPQAPTRCTERPPVAAERVVEDRREQLSCDRHFGKLERYVFYVPGNLRPDLHQLLSKGCQQPVLYLMGQC